MIIRVNMITTHMVIIVLKAIYRGWVGHLANILALIFLALVNILLAALNIEVLGIITMELILHNPYRHITLIVDPLANHLPTGSHPQTYHYPYGNYMPGFYTYRGPDDNDDLEPPRNSMWK